MRSHGQNPRYRSSSVWLSPGTTRYTADLGEMLRVAGLGREFWGEMLSPGIRRSLLPRDVILASQPGGDSACDTRPRVPALQWPSSHQQRDWRGVESSGWLQSASLYALMCAWSQLGLKGRRLPSWLGFFKDVHPCSPFSLNPHFSSKNEVFRTLLHRCLFVCRGWRQDRICQVLFLIF